MVEGPRSIGEAKKLVGEMLIKSINKEQIEGYDKWTPAQKGRLDKSIEWAKKKLGV